MDVRDLTDKQLARHLLDQQEFLTDPSWSAELKASSKAYMAILRSEKARRVQREED